MAPLYAMELCRPSCMATSMVENFTCSSMTTQLLSFPFPSHPLDQSEVGHVYVCALYVTSLALRHWEPHWELRGTPRRLLGIENLSGNSGERPKSSRARCRWPSCGVCGQIRIGDKVTRVHEYSCIFKFWPHTSG